ncbi:hypothetical protein SANA_05850 [Gottschalkiaceae bacterium SANA]|nr:hypothetical protein SANA_05850 [Gottschalkiaceae bacterium SANA]
MKNWIAGSLLLVLVVIVLSGCAPAEPKIENGPVSFTEVYLDELDETMQAAVKEAVQTPGIYRFDEVDVVLIVKDMDVSEDQVLAVKRANYVDGSIELIIGLDDIGDPNGLESNYAYALAQIGVPMIEKEMTVQDEETYLAENRKEITGIYESRKDENHILVKTGEETLTLDSTIVNPILEFLQEGQEVRVVYEIQVDGKALMMDISSVTK